MDIKPLKGSMNAVTSDGVYTAIEESGGGGGGGSGTIEEIQRNGVPLPITNKTVDVVVPTKTSELLNDNDFVPRSDVATLSVFKIPGGDGGEEITTVVEEEPNKFNFNYYKNAQGELSDSVNITFGDEDYFSLATTGYVNQRLVDKQDTLTFDTTPTQNSTNPVTSGGVFEALTGKKGVFVAEYGVSSFADVLSAWQSGAGLISKRMLEEGLYRYGLVNFAENDLFEFVEVEDASYVVLSLSSNRGWFEPSQTFLAREEFTAPKNSPEFTGTPTAPTAAADTNTRQIATTAFVQTAISNAVPSVQTDGNWSYKIYADNSFEAWYNELGVRLNITEQSGAWYRTEKQTLTLPQSLTDSYDWHVAYALVQAGHNNFPVTCSGFTVSIEGIGYFVLSGNTRADTGNFTLSAYVRGTLAAKS